MIEGLVYGFILGGVVVLLCVGLYYMYDNLKVEVFRLQQKRNSIHLELTEYEEFQKWRDTANNVILPLELAENFLQSTEVPRFKRILEAAIYRTKR